jgi:hypothetical protein
MQWAVSGHSIEEGLVHLPRAESLDQLVVIDVAGYLPGRDDEVSFHFGAPWATEKHGR